MSESSRRRECLCEAPDLGEGHARRGRRAGVPVHASVREAHESIDVLVDFTSATAVKGNTLAAIEAGVAVVIGSSGLTAADFSEIAERDGARAGRAPGGGPRTSDRQAARRDPRTA
jgi:dihydrodipicolinate reductase